MLLILEGGGGNPQVYIELNSIQTYHTNTMHLNVLI